MTIDFKDAKTQEVSVSIAGSVRPGIILRAQGSSEIALGIFVDGCCNHPDCEGMPMTYRMSPVDEVQYQVTYPFSDIAFRADQTEEGDLIILDETGIRASIALDEDSVWSPGNDHGENRSIYLNEQFAQWLDKVENPE